MATDEVVVAVGADLHCDIVVGEIVGLEHRMDAVVVAVDLVDDPVPPGREAR